MDALDNITILIYLLLSVPLIFLLFLFLAFLNRGDSQTTQKYLELERMIIELYAFDEVSKAYISEKLSEMKYSDWFLGSSQENLAISKTFDRVSELKEINTLDLQADDVDELIILLLKIRKTGKIKIGSHFDRLLSQINMNQQSL